MITVYSLPSCPQCDQTKKMLKREGHEYKEILLSEDADATRMVQQLGYQSAPVVIVGDTHWSGFRPEKIMALPVV